MLCFWFVCLRLVSCVSNVASFSGLFAFVLCIQCYQFLWIVCLRLVSCVSNVASFSVLFAIRLVYPMLPVSLYCLPFVLCTQCCQFLWIVCLRLVSCVSNVASFSGLFAFVLCLVYPLLPVSLDCLPSSCVLCIQCCQFLCIVCLRLVYPMLPVSLDCLPSSCVSNVASFSGLFAFVLCIQCCQFLWIVCLRLVSCVSNVASFSGLFAFVLCIQCCPFLWIVCLRLLSCVTNVASFSGLFAFVLCLVYPMLPVSLDCLPSSCVLCIQCCQFLCIVCHSSCVPNVASFSGLFAFVLCLVYPMLPVSLDCLPSSCVLCIQCCQFLCIVCLRLVYPMLPVSLDCLPSSCVLCTQCCQFLWIVCHSSCVPNVASFSGLFAFVLCLVYPMLSVSLDCLPSSCVSNVASFSGLFAFVLCLVYPMLPVSLDVCLRLVSCVSNVASFSVLFAIRLVYPMLPVSLDCLPSSCVLCIQCCQFLWIVCLRLVSCVSNVASFSGLFAFVLCIQCCPFLWIVCLRLLSCVTNVASFSGLFAFVLCLVYPMLPVSLDCLPSSCVLCIQCCQFLCIVCHSSCVPNVASFSRLFAFVLCLVYPMLSVSLDCFPSSCVLCIQCCQFLCIVCLRLVYPMLPVSLDCLPSSCVLCTQCCQFLWIVLPFVLCTQCCQFLWIVCLRLVSCVPNVVSFSGLFAFVLCLVYPMLPVSLDCLPSSCVLCIQCCQFLWIVCLRLVSCVSNVASFSVLFAIRLVYPMLPVSLDCLPSSCVLCIQCCQFLWIVFLRLVSCVSNVASFSVLFAFVLCIQCCQFLWIVCLRLVSCVPNVASFSGLFAIRLVYPMLPVSLDCLPSSCVLCIQCCQFLWIVCLRLMSCVSNVASFSVLFAIRLVYPMLPVSLDCLPSSCVLCIQCCQFLCIVCLRLVYPMLPVSLDCLPSSCVLCTQCCQFLWIVCHSSCVPNVASFSGLFAFVLCFVYPMLSVSLDCLPSSCVLCIQCCQFLWIVCLRLVYPMLPVSLDCLPSSCVLCIQCCQFLWIVCHSSCVPNVASFSGLFAFVLCLVYPMLSVSLDCLPSSYVLCIQCCQFLWIVCHSSCVPNVASFSGLFAFVLCLVYPMLSVSLDCLPSSYVLCTQCCQFLCIVCLRLVYPILPVSLDCLPSSCVLCTQCCQFLWIVCLGLVYPMLPVNSGLFAFILCLVYPMLPVSLDCLPSACVLCIQCCQFLWIVCLRLMSCVPNVASFSGLFAFILCLVYPMLPVSLDCLPSSCVLCIQCCQFLWIVCLRLMSCVPNVASFSGLFAFVLYLVYPMLPVSLDCLPSSCVLCIQYCQFLWIVCLRLVSCVSNIASFSGLFAFVLCLVYPILPVSLDCLPSSCVLCIQYCQFLWIVCLRLMSCVPNVASFSVLFAFVLCIQYCQFLWIACHRLVSCVPNVASFYGLFAFVLCTQYCQFLWIICLLLVSCVPNVASFSVLFAFVLCLVYPILPISLECLPSTCVLCTQCCQFLWIVYFRLVSCVPNAASFSGLFAFVLCLVYPMLPVSLDCLPSSYVLCAQCCQFLWIVCIRLVSCVSNVASFSGLFAFVLCLVYPILSVSLDCLPSSCVLCIQYCQFLWIVCLRLVSCVSNIVSFSGLFAFVLCLVYPILPVSLDCLPSSCVLCIQYCQFLWIVCLRLVSCVSNIASFSGLFAFVLCLVYPILPVSLDCLPSSCVLCIQYCQFLWIVCLRLVSCVSNIASFSGLFTFVLCLVYPILSVSLDCLPSSCVLCIQYCQFLWIVCLRLVSCVSNIASFSGLFAFFLCLVYPILPVSLDCLPSSCVLCIQYCQFLWIVCLRLVSFVSNIVSFSGLFAFVLCLVYPILSVSLDCLPSSCVLCIQYCQFLWIVCLRLVSCVSNIASFSGLFTFVLCLVYPMLPVSLYCLPSSCVSNIVSFSGLFAFVLCLVYPILPVSLDCLPSCCVLCIQYCQFLWIVCLRLVSCVSNIASFSGLFTFVLCLVYPMLPVSLYCLPSSCVSNIVSFSGLFTFVLCLLYPILSVSLDCLPSCCVFCIQYCQFLWIVYLRVVSFVSNIASFSGLFTFMLCLVYPILSVSLDCLPSCCVLCTQYCQFLWIVYLRVVSFVSNIASFSGLFTFMLCLVYPILSVSLDCLPSCCVLCTQYCQFLWIVYLRVVSCVPNVASSSGLFALVFCLVYPILSVSLDCLPSSCVLCTQCCQFLWIVCLGLLSCVSNIASFSGCSGFL